MKSLRFIPALLFFLLCGMLLFGLLQHPRMHNFMATSDRALPAFDLPLLDSNSRFTSDTLKNQVSLVHFFATWCGVCMREQSTMIDFANSMKIPIYAVMWRSPDESIPSWKMQKKIYPNVALDYTGQIGMLFGIMGVPHTFLVDKEGRIRYSYVGSISEKEMNKRLIPLIKKYQNES